MDDMQRMMIMQQMLAQQQGQQPQGGRMPAPNMQQSPQFQGMGLDTGKRSPIEEGSMMALNSTKRSLQMNESENKRALGRSLLTLLGSIDNNPAHGTGFAGNLSSIASGISPALLEYDNERNRIEGVNYGLLQARKNEEAYARKEDREMKKMHHEMDISNKRLKIDQGYFGLKKQETEYEKAIETEMSKSGATVPLGRLAKHPSMYNNAQKEIGDNIHRGEAARNTLMSIRGAKKILTDNPDITKNMSVIMLAAQRNDPTIIKQKLNKLFISDKTIKDAQMLSKYLSNIYTSKLPGMPARGMTMFLEKRLAEGSVDMTMAADAALELLNPDEETAEHIYKNGQKVYEELEKGNFYRPAPMKIEGFEKKEPAPVNNGKDSTIKNKYVGLSPAELDAKEAELKAMAGMK
jgi:uncharacterized LabA/DUF88 family protein